MRRRQTWNCIWISAISVASLKANEDIAFFESNVAPLLKANCYKCHSHESGKMKGGLTLDSRSGWNEGGDSGPAVVPGKPEESLLIEAIRHRDPDFKMPPKKKLAEEEIAILTEWVSRGAPDPRTTVPEKDLRELTNNWWSLVPLKRPPLPSADVEHPIDAFIRARLRAAKISPAPPADRRTLIRRLYLNLHGLPPTPAQVKRFVEDRNPRAYEELVNDLLDSPLYGERWARHWLDTIHFADSHGCEHDILRPNAWRFRDYVIRRLNEDVPWDRFIREQLAADILYPEESHLRAGLGFIGAGPLELSRAGTAPVTFDYLDRDDMVTQTMAAFVSTTANCARCHTHKFDPVSQEDYYSLQAVFAGVGKGDIEFDRDPRTTEKRKSLRAMKEAAAQGNQSVVLSPEYDEVVTEWLRQHDRKPVTWQPFEAGTVLSSDGADLGRLADGSYLASGPRPDQDTYTVTGSLTLEKLSAIRLDVLSDESLPMQGPGRQDNGNLHLTEFEARLFEPGVSESVALKFHRATADWNQKGWTILHSLDGELKTAWGIYPKVGASHHAVFELAEPVTLKADTRLVVMLRQLHGGGHLIGRFKLSVTNAPNAGADTLPPAVSAALNVPAGDRSTGQRVAIASHVLQLRAEEELQRLPPRSIVYAASSAHSHGKKLDKPLSAPKTVHVLHRGDIEKPGKIAHPGALAALSALPGRFELSNPEEEASRRAALAEWLAAPENPLTWRSIANRTWHYHFGRGLCDTPNDFGRMGGIPSHPELLDWLAHWFRDDAGGSLKELHRLLLTSETWRQASRHENEHARDVDAENRLLWRMNARRLDAESYRDSLLQITGRIDLAMGGPGIEQFAKSKGPQDSPKLDYEAYDWNQPGATRRSIYRVVWRGIADPFMDALDFPDMALLSPKRGASVSALQALTLFNNDFVLHHSDQLASRLGKDHPTLSAQIQDAVFLIFLREPTSGELKDLTAYARQFGIAALARVLFNSNEFLFID
jgi:mono/diheme cytochrome c family protein